LAEAEARIAQVEARIALERGQATRAQRDFDRLPLDVTEAQRALILREPQMAELEGERDAALAARARAEKALAETVLVVPFDAMVISEDVEPGARVAAGDEVARLVATRRFEAELNVPLTALPWIEAGDSVRLVKPGAWPAGVAREGRVTRIGAALSGGGALAEVVVEIEDPLALDPATAGPAVLLGSFLEARIDRAALPDTVALDRRWLRDGDVVWVMDGEDRLAIRPVEVLWRGEETALIAAGLAPGERVVTTTLGTRAEGMALRTGDPAATEATAAAAGAEDGS
ncbi:MAG: HlyD family efflux transporter periplasmic adaptor subunit, partial [Pseudomonadota bacterium]